MKNIRCSVVGGVSKLFGGKGLMAQPDDEAIKVPQRRHLPAQAGTRDDRRDAEQCLLPIRLKQ